MSEGIERMWRSSGWRLTPLAGVTVGLAAALAVLALAEVTSSVAAGADSTVLGWMISHRSGPLTVAARTVTSSGTSPLLYPLVILVGALVWLRTGQLIPAAAALGVVVTGVLARLGLSKLIGDARPPRADWLAPAQGFSFPSGHATTSALVAGAVAWLLGYVVHGRWPRIAIFALLGSWAVLVALSRLYLGVHWVSDIVGSWLLASAWLTALLATRLRPRPGSGFAPPTAA